MAVCDINCIAVPEAPLEETGVRARTLELRVRLG